MTNFFQNPVNPKIQNPTPPGYNSAYAMMLQRTMQQMQNPYGLSGTGMPPQQGPQPFNPYGNGMGSFGAPGQPTGPAFQGQTGAGGGPQGPTGGMPQFGGQQNSLPNPTPGSAGSGSGSSSGGGMSGMQALMQANQSQGGQKSTGGSPQANVQYPGQPGGAAPFPGSSSAPSAANNFGGVGQSAYQIWQSQGSPGANSGSQSNGPATSPQMPPPPGQGGGSSVDGIPDSMARQASLNQPGGGPQMPPPPGQQKDNAPGPAQPLSPQELQQMQMMSQMPQPVASPGQQQMPGGGMNTGGNPSATTANYGGPGIAKGFARPGGGVTGLNGRSPVIQPGAYDGGSPAGNRFMPIHAPHMASASLTPQGMNSQINSQGQNARYGMRVANRTASGHSGQIYDGGVGGAPPPPPPGSGMGGTTYTGPSWSQPGGGQAAAQAGVDARQAELGAGPAGRAFIEGGQQGAAPANPAGAGPGVPGGGGLQPQGASYGGPAPLDGSVRFDGGAGGQGFGPGGSAELNGGAYDGKRGAVELMKAHGSMLSKILPHLLMAAAQAHQQGGAPPVGGGMPPGGAPPPPQGGPPMGGMPPRPPMGMPPQRPNMFGR